MPIGAGVEYTAKRGGNAPPNHKSAAAAHHHAQHSHKLFSHDSLSELAFLNALVLVFRTQCAEFCWVVSVCYEIQKCQICAQTNNAFLPLRRGGVASPRPLQQTVGNKRPFLRLRERVQCTGFCLVRVVPGNTELLSADRMTARSTFAAAT